MKSISQMTFEQRALLFAKLAEIAYMSPKEVKKPASKMNFTEVEFYDNGGAQAYRFMNKHDIVIACRGTEPTQWNDIKADLKAIPVMAETVSRVHKGFKAEVDDLWPMVKEDLESVGKSRKAWFCGHSLGAAMTTIMASRCNYDVDMPDIEEVYTFGSPRVGFKRYCGSLNVAHHRFVNNNDIVTRVPLWIMGYRHHGTMHYFNRHGDLAKMTWGDRLRGMWDGLKKGSIDVVADHPMSAYMPCVQKMQ